ncbi:MAG: hypothetical protein M3R38_37810 [Actinomycetota bacterium]|nr:hypothetical protein [Actinomycetota bacterium]
MDEQSIARRVVERAPKQGQQACRADRALALYVEHAETIALGFRAGVYRVPSRTEEGKTYAVRLVPSPSCTCPDFRGGECLHVMAARVAREHAAPCSSCGCRFRHRELEEAPEDSLTWFPGDRLCQSCIVAHGGIS